MKISVQWETPEPKAAKVASQISEEIGLEVTGEVVSVHKGRQCKHQRLNFECESLGCHSDVPLDRRYEKKYNGFFTGWTVAKWLENHYDIRTTILVEGLHIGTYACVLERRVVFLEEALRKAIEALKRTRSWVRNKLFAEIRRDLEAALAQPRE